ncbi:MAG: DUF4115 domain-containing protein [Psychromonas sp.]|nr:DUF4115 domain-containing protein [Psychromonas sp.]
MKTDDNQSPEIIVPLGKALKDARLASKLSIDEVAEKLNLGPCTVYDLEDELTNIVAANKYPVIYLRGYLANYAKLVGLNTLELFVEYQQLESGSKNKPTLQRSTLIIPPTKKRSKLLPISLFVIIVVALIYLLQQPLLATLNKYIPISDSVPIEVTKTGTTQKLLIATNISQETEQLSTINLSDEDSSIKVKSDPVAVEKVNHETDEPAAEVKEVEVDEAQVIESQVNQVEPKVAVEVESSPPAESEASFEASESNSNSRQELVEQAVEKELATGPESLMLAFNAECWTEVFDATGKRIAFGLYKNGRVLTLSGIAPFQLKLGDPSVVEIQYQDQIIEGEFTPGRSAQFSVPLS